MALHERPKRIGPDWRSGPGDKNGKFSSQPPNPTDEKLAYCNRGVAFAEKGDYEKALADLATGIQKDGSLPLCYFVRGNVYSHTGKYQTAVDDFTKCLQLKPDYVGALVKRGEAFERLGDREKALADFRSALELAPDFKDAQEGVTA